MTLDVAIGLQCPLLSVSHDEDSFETLPAKLAQHRVVLVVLEATGSLEMPAVYAWQAAGRAVTVVNPWQARDFARAIGKLAKTDCIDARVLAQLGEVIKRHPAREKFIKPWPTLAQQMLAALVTRR
jgi:transposase